MEKQKDRPGERPEICINLFIYSFKTVTKREVNKRTKYLINFMPKQNIL